MVLFFHLLVKILPLYIIVALGYVGGRYLKIDGRSVSVLTIYIVAPVVVFGSLATTSFSFSHLALPLIFYILCCSISVFSYFVTGRLFNDGTRNLLGFASGDSNTGYFGLPVAILLFSPAMVGLYLLSSVCMVFYENTLGYYFLSRGTYSTRQAVKNMLFLPLLWATAAGLAMSFFTPDFGPAFSDLLEKFKGACSVLGMMIVGISLSKSSRFIPDWKFIGAALCTTFIVWSGLVVGLVLADRYYFRFYGSEIHSIGLLIAAVPIAANVAAFSSMLNVHADKAASAVLVSTVVSLFFIPALFILFPV